MNIKSTKIDLSVSILKGITGSIPYVGSLISEVLGHIIPNQRIERICALLEVMEYKLEAMENLKKEQIKKIFNSPEYIDLLEDSFIQASRALSATRLEYIASILVNTLTEEEINYTKNKMFLILLGQLTDLEIILLASKHFSFSEFPDFHERHKEIIRMPTLTLRSDKQELDKNDLQNNYMQHLTQLGLLKQEFKFKACLNHGLTNLEVDMKPSGYSLTKLGENFLCFIKISPI